MTEKQPIQHAYYCQACHDPQPITSATALQEHLKTQHAQTSFKGKKQAQLFMDGEGGSFKQIWEITLDSGIKILHSVSRGM